MRILVYGHLHHKNKIGLDLVSKKIPVIYLENLENLNKLDDGETILFITNSLQEVSFSKVIYGPHIDFEEMVKQCQNIQRTIKFNTLSNWNKNNAEKLTNNSLVEYITLPFPVDTGKFKPGIKEEKSFIYFKNTHSSKLEIAKKLLNDIGIPYKIFVYGSYKEEEYLEYISKSKFGIWVGSHESQGFALQEALSCDCPLFVLDVNSMKDECFNDNYYPWKNRQFSFDDLEATSASYWNDKCGILVKNNNEYKVIFEKFLNTINIYKPREFIEKNFSVENFMKKIVEIFNLFNIVSSSWNHICYHNKLLDIYKLKTIHNAGFFSCCSKRLDEIIIHFNKYKKVPEILDSSSQFRLYKPTNDKKDITSEYFQEKENITINFENPINFNCEKLQFTNYKNLNLNDISPFIQKYFEPSVKINSLIKNIEDKYHLNYEKICVLFYRGNDKATETQLPLYEDYIKLGKKIQSEDKDIKFLIQSDETEFINKMKLEFPENIIFYDEIRHISKNINLSVDKLDQNINFQFSKNFLAITLIMSKCKYLICNSGNCSFWIYFYRNSLENSYLFVKDIWV